MYFLTCSDYSSCSQRRQPVALCRPAVGYNKNSSIPFVSRIKSTINFVKANICNRVSKLYNSILNISFFKRK
jgi:hypothetical protein